MGNSSNNSSSTSISNPHYGASTGYLAGTKPNQAEINFQNEENRMLADKANQEYRHENPLLAVADDTITLIKQLLYVGVGVSVGYLGLQAYSTYKQTR